MPSRFLVPILAAALAANLTVPASAEPGSWLEPPAVAPGQTLPKAPRGDRTRNIEFLFGALKVAPDETSAKAVEQRIWALWVVSQSDTANLLMTRVRTALEAKDTDLAIKLLDGIVKIKPDYIEAWNRRATLYYMKKDFGSSLADIREVLKREPRHFGALMGLAMIMTETGDDKQALEVYRRVLAVYPRMQRIPELVKTLQEKVEGRDI
jgi:tetratricopeptide (TPR) repeat protein